MMTTRRKSEMWISNNRVLVGGNKRIHGRNPNFETEETKVLISLWGDPKIQKTLITTHKKHPVIVKLAEKMREFGYYRSPEEINTRIKNLKCFYNRIKKDLEIGTTTDPTWKHYAAMEQIMTRPIFSVRPDEIPKPSARYKMEEEASGGDVAESKRRKGNGNVGDDSSTSEDDEELFTQEMLLDTMDESEEKPDTSEIDIGQGQQDENNDEDDDVEISALIEPKQEPIDIDDDEMEVEKESVVEEASDIFPKLSAYLQITSSGASSTSIANSQNKIITTLANSANSKEINTSIANAIKLSQPIMITTPQTARQQGQLSLVPTNFLLKQPQQQLQIRPQHQHILYTKPAMTANQAAQGSGQMPMKVLLVNTLQKTPGATTVQASVTDSHSQPKISSVTTIKSNVLPTVVNGNDIQNHQKAKPVTTKPTLKPKSEGTVGLRGLLTQLVQLQNESLDVAKQRLEIERQRFDFEKSIAERIISALPMFQNTQTAQIPQQSQDYIPPLLIPKIEKED